MHHRYKDHATFLTVYVREAHPTDGWRMASNDKAGVVVAQPTTAEDRTRVAGDCSVALKMTMPLLVDTLDDRVGHAYSGMPDRLYVIDRAGRIAYQGGRGPFGFRPAEMEQTLMLLLLEQQGPRAVAGRPRALRSDRRAAGVPDIVGQPYPR
jgi:hypothetical protein